MPEQPDNVIRRELQLVGLYRMLEAATLCLLLFGPVPASLEPRHPLTGSIAAVAYLLAAGVLYFAGRRGHPIRTLALAGALADVAAAILAMHALPGAWAGIAMLLLFNIGATALLLPFRLGVGIGVLAALALFGERLWSALFDPSDPQRTLAEVSMFAISYLGAASVANFAGRQMQATQELAEQRGSQVANLAEINELIIRRMRTGVLLVDGDDGIRLANESAALLLGGGTGRNLGLAAPELAQRLHRWRHDGNNDPHPLRLAADLPEVQPRFVRLLAEDEQALVFLDDTTLLSQRAESMTLATLGRFSASLAHEIRNPLAAISYATQLMQESPEIPVADRRLLEIIHQQTQRMNGIVENVLGLARRERAQPEHVDLASFVRHFVEDYLATQPLEGDVLEALAPPRPLVAMVDRRQLQQAVTVLVHNALVYGRLPGEPARVIVHAHADESGAPLLDVADRGPGIPDAVAAQLFRPFFTTSGHGTGLGLYIARELCQANQATLDYVPLPAGGACFRIRMVAATARALAG